MVVKGVPAWQRSSLRSQTASLGRSLEERFGLEIELSAVRAEELGSLPFTMMWCELVGGHHVVRGDSEVLRAAPEMAPDRLPLFEGVHYLSNRAALILWSLVEDLGADRTWKFIHKAWLAIGAAVLIADHRFEVGYGPRLDALERGTPEGFPELPMLLDRYREASVARQMADPGSLWHHYRRLIALRRGQPALGQGGYAPVDLDGDGADNAIAWLRTHGESRLLAVANLAPRPLVELRARVPAGDGPPVTLLGETRAEPAGDEALRIPVIGPRELLLFDLDCGCAMK